MKKNFFVSVAAEHRRSAIENRGLIVSPYRFYTRCIIEAKFAVFSTYIYTPSRPCITAGLTTRLGFFAGTGQGGGGNEVRTAGCDTDQPGPSISDQRRRTCIRNKDSTLKPFYPGIECMNGENYGHQRFCRAFIWSGALSNSWRAVSSVSLWNLLSRIVLRVEGGLFTTFFFCMYMYVLRYPTNEHALFFEILFSFYVFAPRVHTIIGHQIIWEFSIFAMPIIIIPDRFLSYPRVKGIHIIMDKTGRYIIYLLNWIRSAIISWSKVHIAFRYAADLPIYLRLVVKRYCLIPKFEGQGRWQFTLKFIHQIDK